MNKNLLKNIAIFLAIGFVMVFAIPFVFGEAASIVDLVIMMALVIADDHMNRKR